MMTIQSSPLLRQALVADATTSAAFGLMMLIGAGPLSGIFGLPEMLLRTAGLVLLPYAAFIGWLGLREQIHKPIAWAVVLGNALWVVDSLLLLVSGWVSPTSAGYAFGRVRRSASPYRDRRRKAGHDSVSLLAQGRRAFGFRSGPALKSRE